MFGAERDVEDRDTAAQSSAITVHKGFEVPAALVTNSSIFWDTTPCSMLKVKQRFGVTWCLQLQGRRMSHVRIQRKASSTQNMLLAWLILRP
jgi:hypothetical protein